MSTSESGGRHRGLTLAAVCVAGGLLPASLTGSSVALPKIGADLGAQLTSLQWVVNSYNLTFASLMLATGALADLVGRRRMFTFGAGLFFVCSLLSGLVSDVLLLNLLRGVSGVGAAAVLTAGSAMLAATFDGAARARAFGILGSSFGAGLALGPSTSGLLVQAWGWRAVFLSHAVIGLLVLLAIPAMTESRDPGATQVDWAGTLTFTGALFLVTFAMVEGPQHGWGSVPVLAMLAGFVLLLVAFVVAERLQQRPMFDLGLFSQPKFVAISMMPVALAFGFVCLLVFLPSYFMGALGYSSQRAGLVMLLLTLPVLVFPVISGMVVRRISAPVLLGLSLLLVAGGAVWLTGVNTHTTVGGLLGPLMIIGVGVGISFGLLDGAAISSVPAERAGMAAGMFNTMRLASEAIAIAGMGSLLVTLTQGQIDAGIDRFGARHASVEALANQTVQGHLPATADGVVAADRHGLLQFLADSYTGALHSVLWILAAVCAVGAPLIVLLLRERVGRGQHEPAAVVPAPAPAESSVSASF